jgi:hypothetical protein
MAGHKTSSDNQLSVSYWRGGANKLRRQLKQLAKRRGITMGGALLEAVDEALRRKR